MSGLSFYELHQTSIEIQQILGDAQICATKSFSDPSVTKILSERQIVAQSANEALYVLTDIASALIDSLSESVHEKRLLQIYREGVAGVIEKNPKFTTDNLEFIEVTGFLIEELNAMGPQAICVNCLEKEKMIIMSKNKNEETFFELKSDKHFIIGIIVPHQHGISKCFICGNTLMGSRMMEPESLRDMAKAAQQSASSLFNGV